MKYLNLENAIELINEPNRTICLRFLKENNQLLQKAMGSKSKHQAWEGGYLEHICETMNLALLLFDALESTNRKLPFSISDALLVLFLHDIEKPWKQSQNNTLKLESEEGIKDNDAIKVFQKKIIGDYGFILSEEQVNALKYIEGEGKDYHPFNRVENELAAFCHLCDHTSARVWYDYPKKLNDPWKTTYN